MSASSGAITRPSENRSSRNEAFSPLAGPWNTRWYAHSR